MSYTSRERNAHLIQTLEILNNRINTQVAIRNNLERMQGSPNWSQREIILRLQQAKHDIALELHWSVKQDRPAELLPIAA